MSPAELFYVDGVAAICLALPTLLVAFWVLDRARQGARSPKPQTAHAHPAGAPHSA